MNTILNVKEVTDLSTEPVSLTEAKAWMKIAFTDDDAIITDLITSARKVLEKHTGMSFGVKKYTALMDVKAGWVDLPYGPVNAVVCVSLVNGVDDEDELYEGLDYELRNGLLRITLDGCVSVTYTTKYDVPEDLKTDILKLVAYYYQNRGIQFESDVRRFPDWEHLAANYYAKVVI